MLNLLLYLPSGPWHSFYKVHPVHSGLPYWPLMNPWSCLHRHCTGHSDVVAMKLRMSCDERHASSVPEAVCRSGKMAAQAGFHSAAGCRARPYLHHGGIPCRPASLRLQNLQDSGEALFVTGPAPHLVWARPAQCVASPPLKSMIRALSPLPISTFSALASPQTMLSSRTFVMDRVI